MGEQAKNPHVVVVEDDEAMNEAIGSLLDAAGYGAVTFPSGEALLEAGAARNSRCLVMDINLPGLSGFEVYKRLGESGLRVPVIFITAFDDPASQSRAQDAGAIAYLTKPFPGQKLLAAIQRAFEGPKPAGQLNYP